MVVWITINRSVALPVRRLDAGPLYPNTHLTYIYTCTYICDIYWV